MQDHIEDITDLSDTLITLLIDIIPEGLMPEWARFIEMTIDIEETKSIEMTEELL